MENREQLLETIAANIRTVRKEKNLTQGDLSQRCGIPQSHISKIESGKHELNLKTIVVIAGVLETSTRHLLVPRDEKNLHLFEKLERIEALPKEERQAIERVIDMALLSSQHNLSRNQELEKLKTTSNRKQRER